MIVELDRTLQPSHPEAGTDKELTAGLSALGELDGCPVVGVDLPGTIRHAGLIRYLETCWASHLVPVISPDTIWYTILGEIASFVKADPEKYRALFTTSDKKTELVVVSSSLVRLPLDRIVELLRLAVPTDVGLFLPVFSTSTERSRAAFYAAFADAVSPFYSYSMMLCGFPAVKVTGTQEDWERLRTTFGKLPDLGHVAWHKAVSGLIDSLAVERCDPNFWADMFSLERCGSGHQTEVKGWISKLYHPGHVKGPRYVGNYPLHASKVDYKQLDTGKKYTMFYGLFGSTLANGVLTPDFGSVIFEVIPEKDRKKPKPEDERLLMYRDRKPIAVLKQLSGKWVVDDESDALTGLHGVATD